MIGGENLMYVMCTVYILYHHRNCTENENAKSMHVAVCISVFLLSFFKTFFFFFSSTNSIRSMSRAFCSLRIFQLPVLCVVSCLCAYLHFAYGQRICFLPLNTLFFVVTVECSRLKLTPNIYSLSLLSSYRLFVCPHVCIFCSNVCVCCSLKLHWLRAFTDLRIRFKRIIKCVSVSLFQIMCIFPSFIRKKACDVTSKSLFSTRTQYPHNKSLSLNSYMCIFEGFCVCFFFAMFFSSSAFCF